MAHGKANQAFTPGDACAEGGYRNPAYGGRSSTYSWIVVSFGAVMLFSDRLTEKQQLEAKDSGRDNMLDMLLRDFRKAFPDLTFEPQLDFKLINAQAFQLQDRRVVTIYGGLAHHPRLGPESLAFILLHETGHHLAEGCRLPRDPLLACECAADYWATTTGAEQLRLESGRCLQMPVAVAELNEVMNPRQKSAARYTNKASTAGCWAKGWSSRSRALLEQTRPPTNTGCCVTYI